MTASKPPLRKKAALAATKPVKASAIEHSVIVVTSSTTTTKAKANPELARLAARVTFLEQQLKELKKADSENIPGPEFFDDVVRTLVVIKAAFADCRWWRLGHEMIGLEVIDPKFAGLNRVKRLRLVDSVLETLEARPLNRIMECHPRTPSEV